MKPESLLGVWVGNAHNNNGWDMKITISIFSSHLKLALRWGYSIYP